MKPVRIQMKRIKGFRLQTVSMAINGLPAMYVGRPGPFGNPYKIGRNPDVSGTPTLTAEQAVYEFRYFWPAIAFQRQIDAHDLQGKNLACWCPLFVNGEYCICHDDVLISIANNITMEEVKDENVRWSKRKTA